MKNIVLEKPGDFQTFESEIDKSLKPDEALLKVHRIGICGTDLHAYAGEQPFFSYPRILGHELGVEVVEVGKAVANVTPGDRCSVEPYRYTDPSGPAVRKGKPNCAEDLSVLGVHEDGGMREYFKFPAKFLHPSDQLTFDQLALIEPLGIGCHAVNRAGVTNHDNVLVIGAGPIGLGAIQFSQVSAQNVVVMDINDDRLQFCKKTLGIEHTVNPTADTDTEDRLRQILGGELPDIVLDATGSKQSMENAFDYVGHGGKLVYIGLFRGEVTFHDPSFHKKELTLMASRNALASDFKQLIKTIERGEIDTDPWITHHAKFNEMVDRFDDWIKPETGVIKAIVEL